MNFCPNCGREFKEGAKFCGGCGLMIADYQEPAKAATKAATSGTFEDYAKETKAEENVFEQSVKKPDFGPKKTTFDDIGVKEPRYSDYSQTRSGSADTGSTYRSANTETVYPEHDSYSASETNGFGIASLICGIVAILFNLFFFIPGILAIVFGVVGLNRAKQSGNGRGISMAGLILGIITTAGWLILIICGITFATVMSVM